MKLNFQDSATSVMEGIIDFHHDVQFYLIIIVTFVAWMLFSIVYEFGVKMYIEKHNKIEDVLHARKLALVTKNVTHGMILEIIWTLIPVGVLIAIAIPSFALLYSIDEIIDPSLTIKVTGHQWYWSYEYTDYENEKIMFDSYLVTEDDLKLGDLRLLEVDRKVWLPVHTYVRVLITAVDVIHAWAIPAFGIKMDALPGRLNQVSLYVKREGVFYGQCSEICGVNHGFMPIAVKVVPLDVFEIWAAAQLNKE
jgi:cytochrome c oxidase subunit 2